MTHRTLMILRYWFAISDAGILAIKRELLNDPCLTSKKLKDKLNLIASLQTISEELYTA